MKTWKTEHDANLAVLTAWVNRTPVHQSDEHLASVHVSNSGTHLLYKGEYISSILDNSRHLGTRIDAILVDDEAKYWANMLRFLLDTKGSP